MIEKNMEYWNKIKNWIIDNCNNQTGMLIALIVFAIVISLLFKPLIMFTVGLVVGLWLYYSYRDTIDGFVNKTKKEIEENETRSK